MRTLLAAVVVVVLALADATAQTPIYKCKRPGQSVVYQDSPCGPQQTQLALDLGDVPTSGPADSEFGQAEVGPTNSPHVLKLNNGEVDAAVPAPKALKPIHDRVAGESSPLSAMTAVVQTLVGLLFASILVALVAWKARKRPGEGDESQSRDPDGKSAQHAHSREGATLWSSSA